MKRYSLIRIASCTGLLALGLSGCLKDKNFEDGRVQASSSETLQHIIELGITATDATNYLALQMEASSKDTTVAIIPVRLASAEPAAEDITVTLEMSDELIDDYNTANGTNYEKPPSSVFTEINGTKVVIPKGSNEAYLRVKFVPDDFVGQEYAFAYRITGVSGNHYTISRNLKSGIVGVVILNKYDGHYTVTGTMTDLTAPTITGKYPFEMDLVTVNANSVYMYYSGPGGTGAYHPILSAGSNSVYGSFSPQFTVDALSKISTVVNAYGQNAGALDRSGQIDPAGFNDYDPSTKTFRVSYYMLQPGTTVRTKFTETFTFQRKRS